MLYTFNIVKHNNLIFAGHWEGIYKKNDSNSRWELSSESLPTKFAITNLKAFQDILVVFTSERKVKGD